MGIAAKQQSERPELRFKNFRAVWNPTEIGKLFKVVVGFVGTVSTEYCSPEEGVLFVRTLNVKDGHFSQNQMQYVTKEFHKRNKKSQIYNGDILIARVGANMGLVCEVRGLKAEANSANVVIIKKNEKLVSSFYSYYLSSTYGKKQIFALGAGGAQEVLNIGVVKKMVVPQIDFNEQQKIGDFLGTVDEWLDNLRAQRKALEKYKRGMMRKIFSREIRFKDDNGKDFPDWEEKRLGQIEDSGDLKLGRGNVISKRDMVSNPGEYPIYSSSVKDNGLFGKYGSYMFDEELITWSVDGGGHFFYRPKHKFSITNVSGWMRVLNNSMVAKFLAYQLQYHHTKLVFDYSSKAHPSVIRGMYTISLPSKQEQQKIAEFLSSLDELIDAKAEQIAKAEQWKKGLMQKMFV